LTTTGRGGRAAPSSAPNSRLAGLLSGSLMRVLAFVFNFLSLNIVLLVASLPVVTAPMALNATMVALDRWRDDGEGRVVREFLSAFRTRAPVRTTVAVGAPLVVIAVALEEVHYFVRGGSLVAWLCLGSGVAALLVGVASTGYVLLIASRYPSASVPDLWSLCLGLGLRNLLVTGPLFAVELAAALLLGLLDPALLLIGLPLALMFLLRITVEVGARRTGFTPSVGQCP
jgi:hypothetical protein